MRYSGRSILLIILLAVMANPAHALEFSASVDRNVVRAGARVNLKLEVSGQGADAASVPRLSEMKGFDVYSQGTSQSYRMSAGSAPVHSIIYNYMLVPQKTGELVMAQPRARPASSGVATADTRVA